MTLSKVRIDIYEDGAMLRTADKEKQITGCDGKLHACIMALQAIQNPCKIELNCDHPIPARLIPEMDKSVHNINILAQGYDRDYVLSLLILMKKIKNIILTQGT